jgi:hypothetical protein
MTIHWPTTDRPAGVRLGDMSISLDAADSQPPTGTQAPARPSAAGSRWAWWVLRLLASVQVLDAFLQSVLAGRFLSGDFPMLGLHRLNGTIVGGTSITVLVAALALGRYAGLPWRIVVGLALLGPIAALQIFLGFTRVLGIHIPLGVAFIALGAWLTVWLWTRHPEAPRTAAETDR